MTNAINKTLEHHLFLDRVLAFIIKPIMLAQLYFMYVFTNHLVKQSGRKRDFNYDVMHEALMKTFKIRDKTKRGVHFFYARWFMTTICNICILDNAYSTLLRTFLNQYYIQANKMGLKI